MVYDLEDLNMWEPVLYGATSRKQLILDVLKRKETKMMGKINKVEEVCKCVSLCVYVYVYICVFVRVHTLTYVAALV